MIPRRGAVAVTVERGSRATPLVPREAVGPVEAARDAVPGICSPSGRRSRCRWCPWTGARPTLGRFRMPLVPGGGSVALVIPPLTPDGRRPRLGFTRRLCEPAHGHDRATMGARWYRGEECLHEAAGGRARVQGRREPASGLDPPDLHRHPHVCSSAGCRESSACDPVRTLTRAPAGLERGSGRGG